MMAIFKSPKMPVWHQTVSQCKGIEDVETGKKLSVDPTARYASKFQFYHLTNSTSLVVNERSKQDTLRGTNLSWCGIYIYMCVPQ